jgi:hypothetical protein
LFSFNAALLLVPFLISSSVIKISSHMVVRTPSTPRFPESPAPQKKCFSYSTLTKPHEYRKFTIDYHRMIAEEKVLIYKARESWSEDSAGNPKDHIARLNL